jgi:Putative esterase
VKSRGRALARLSLLVGVSLTVALMANSKAQAQSSPNDRFEVSFPSSVKDQPVTGRLYVLISRTNVPEVRLQSMWFNGPEIIATDVDHLMPGQTAVIDSKPLGTPLPSLSDIQPGDYYVQAVLNVYTQFHRADGHVIWAHADHGEGQVFNKSPGNLYSKAVKLHIDHSGPLKLSLTEVIPPIPPEPDTEWVKHIRVQSKLLTQFWGTPTYMGAVVLLPKDYAAHPNTRYPVVYYQPEHFRAFPPFEFTTTPVQESEGARHERESSGYETGYEFSRAWMSDSFPRVIAVSFQTPTPFSDWSGTIDSPNNGPYDQAIMTELIPRIEEQFRTIREPYARVLTGKHSGGRAALALQLHHAAFFGGAWVFHPWPFNFERWSSLDIYRDENVFEVQPNALPEGLQTIAQWKPPLRYFGRTSEGAPFVSAHQLSNHDAVMASVGAGDPIGADDAICGPVGTNGYPRRLWDRTTGKLDHEVAEHWREHCDLADYTKRNWARIGNDLVDKLHLYIGDMDVFYRNLGMHMYQDFLKTTQNPHYEGSFWYGPLENGHQPMTNAELVKIMAEHIERHSPAHQAER